MLRYLFSRHSSRKTVSHGEQIMSKDKYPSIFSRQMETTVFIILQIFFATCAISKIREYSRILPKFSWGIHSVTLDLSCASESIWWIISSDFCVRTLPVPSSEQFFESCSETMEDCKEWYLMVWTSYMSPCNAIVGLYFKCTSDVISVTMEKHKVHKSVL